ncbi:hypothetical protein GDO78_020902 [Eleutherodactylus coqui]|uniref:Uncharacterized protein n=1 Tax=Eleutherodactylus coqui TaxID=57060 RepID=A0A8J6JTE5_ELECQ|nr:hypothetical protein GDO78_020902 [Eleutherodactylus coqui]
MLGAVVLLRAYQETSGRPKRIYRICKSSGGRHMCLLLQHCCTVHHGPGEAGAPEQPITIQLLLSQSHKANEPWTLIGCFERF